MTIDRRKLRWNGWGWNESDFDLGGREDAVWAWIRETLGLESLESRPARSLESIELRAPSLSETVLEELRAHVGEDGVKLDAYERAFHARGRSYADLLVLRAGDLAVVPDAVVYPRSADEVLALVQLAADHGIALVPYGGGSSVVGGVSATKGEAHTAVVTVDTTLMDRVLEVDPVSMTATIEAGIYGPKLERDLATRGCTLGHYPQSFEFSTLGGWVAARGAGQQSNRYGKAEDWLVSARLATPAGFWQTEAFPASAAGPDLNDLVAGCEGSLGIITEATVRVHARPEDRDYRGYLFRDFGHGVEAMREVRQHGLPVAMMRLSDAVETDFFSSFSRLRHPAGRVERAAERALEVAGWGEGRCMMLVGIEGESKNVEAASSRTASLLRRRGGFPLGRKPGDSWYKNRFAMPYLRDPLLDRGIGVDTLETSTHWSNVLRLHRRVIEAIETALQDRAASERHRAMVMCHISHCYEDGASLYFTFVFPQAAAGSELAQWHAVKKAASDAIASGGGTISHHHGVGTDHAPWLAHEKGEIGTSVLRAIKQQLDPKGILNPGKLIP
jgi:alkyldihydroxyacetonephosphate synthase